MTYTIWSGQSNSGSCHTGEAKTVVATSHESRCLGGPGLLLRARMAPGEPQSIVRSPRRLGSEISDGRKATAVSSSKEDEVSIETETTPFLTRILHCPPPPHCAPSHHMLTAPAAPYALPHTHCPIPTARTSLCPVSITCPALCPVPTPCPVGLSIARDRGPRPPAPLAVGGKRIGYNTPSPAS